MLCCSSFVIFEMFSLFRVRFPSLCFAFLVVVFGCCFWLCVCVSRALFALHVLLFSSYTKSQQTNIIDHIHIDRSHNNHSEVGSTGGLGAASRITGGTVCYTNPRLKAPFRM